MLDDRGTSLQDLLDFSHDSGPQEDPPPPAGLGVRCFQSFCGWGTSPARTLFWGFKFGALLKLNRVLQAGVAGSSGAGLDGAMMGAMNLPALECIIDGSVSSDGPRGMVSSMYPQQRETCSAASGHRPSEASEQPDYENTGMPPNVLYRCMLRIEASAGASCSVKLFRRDAILSD